MTIESTLPKSAYIRLSLLLFFQNKFLYIYLAICGLITAYALSSNNYLLLFVAWLPYVGYLLVNILATLRNSSADDQPFLLPTRYTFEKKEIRTSTSLGQGKFKWDDFVQWRLMANCYVLFHKEGFMLVINQSSVPSQQVRTFEMMLNERVGDRH